MGLLSSLKIGKKSAAPATPGANRDAADAVREARIRARRRLIGAAVLLGIGIIGFPLLFESRPRPIPVDVAIDIPPRDGAAALPAPLAKTDAHRPDAALAEPIDEPPASAAGAEKTPTAAASSPSTGSAAKAAAGLAAAAGVAAAVSSHHDGVAAPAASGVKADVKAQLARPGSSAPVVKPAAKTKVEAKPELRAETKADDKAAAAAKAKDKEAAAAKAAAAKAAVAKAAARKDEARSDTQPPADKVADQGRFVVQVGAFSEVAAAHDARMKVEHLGMKTYTQVIESSSGRRIRVRVGPYASKAEAEKAAARIKAAGGLAAAVLVL
jgi:DedD protein